MKLNKSVENQLTEKQRYTYLPDHMILFVVAAICIAVVMTGCDTRNVDASAETDSKKENNMESTQTVTTLQNNIPPIDAAVLTKTKTATFAMG